jgi:TfoX/Sxy family transcriptional regulator of competence genes
MAFDEGLATRIREMLAGDASVSEKKMFGGLCFLMNGNMCFGVVGDDLMVRVGAERWQESLALPHAREMDFTGKSMKGMVFVSPDGTAEDPDLLGWLRAGLDCASALPPKR